MSGEQKPKRNRRTKEQMNKEAEEYVCPCGKVYYSYTALYTHIKQQHANKPQGLIKRPTQTPNRIIGASIIDNHNKTLNIKPQRNPLNYLSQSLQQYNSDLQFHQKIHEFYEKNQTVQSLLNPTQYKPKKHKKVEKEPQISIQKGIQIMIKELQQLKVSTIHKELLVVASALLIKYIIYQTEDPSVTYNGSINLLIQYVNYYLTTTFKTDMKKHKQLIGSGWLGIQVNFMKVMSIVFQWLLFKQYTLTIVQFNGQYYEIHKQQNNPKRKPQHNIQILQKNMKEDQIQLSRHDE